MTLEIQFARWEFTQNGEVLTTTDITPPLRLVRYTPTAPAGDDALNVRETFDVVVAREADTWLRLFNGTFSRARYWAREMRFRRDLRTVIRVRDNRRHSGETWFEAPLYDGRVEFIQGNGKYWRVRIERGPYWRGPETRLRVQNTGGSGLGAWADDATIYNHDDDMPGHNNWVLVEPPGGDAPTPIRLVAQNTYATTPASRLKQVRVGWYNQPQQLALDVVHATGATLEPEDEAYSYNRRGSGSAFQWVVNNTAFQDFTGMFKVLANGFLQGNNWQVSVGYELTRMQHPPQGYVAGANGWTDLGNLVLPAGTYVHPERYPLKVWLEGTGTGILDFVLFAPVNQDTFIRELTFRGYDAQVGTCIEDDATRGEVAYLYGSQRVPVVETLGYPVLAQPQTMLPQALPANAGIPNAQMLSFTLMSNHGQAEALRTARVEVFARPLYAILP